MGFRVMVALSCFQVLVSILLAQGASVNIDVNVTVGREKETGLALSPQLSPRKSRIYQGEWFYIKSKFNGLVLDLDGHGSDNTPIVTSPVSQQDTQLWTWDDGQLVNKKGYPEIKRTMAIFEYQGKSTPNGQPIRLLGSSVCPEEYLSVDVIADDAESYTKKYIPGIYVRKSENSESKGKPYWLSKEKGKEFSAIFFTGQNWVIAQEKHLGQMRAYLWAPAGNAKCPYSEGLKWYPGLPYWTTGTNQATVIPHQETSHPENTQWKMRGSNVIINPVTNQAITIRNAQMRAGAEIEVNEDVGAQHQTWEFVAKT